MRVLMCSWKDEAHPLAGGAESWTGAVLRHWAALGIDVVLASSDAYGAPASEVLHGVQIRRGGGYRHGVQRHARAVFEEEGPFDLVVDQINTRPFGAPRWTGGTSVVALAFQVAREVWDAEMGWPVAKIGRHVLEPRWLRAYRNVLTFTVSSSSAASLHGYGLRRIEVLPMAAPVELGPRLARVTKDPSPTFVTCGRLSRSKRPDHAVQAFRLVSQVLPDARLWLIGSGPLEERLRRDLPANAELLGHLATYDRDDRLSRAHALLMTSVREGWGLVVSESAAVGTRTIGYRVDGLVDSITACDGVLVDADPEALAQAMLDHWSAFAEAGPPPSTGTVPLEEMSQILLEHSFANAGALV